MQTENTVRFERRDEQRFEGRVASIEITFDSPDHPSWEDLDYFGVCATQALAELLPGVKIHVKFIKGHKLRIGDFTTTKIEHSFNDDPNRLTGSFELVPGNNDWGREIQVLVSPQAREFLWVDSRWPRETKFVYSICSDVSRAWSNDFPRGALDEMRLALSTRLPLSIVCHIAADLCYRFETYGTGRGKHDDLAHTLMQTMNYLDNLIGTRVEHQLLSHGVVIARPSKGKHPLNTCLYPESFRTLKRTPLLTDGIRGALWLTPDGQPICVLTPETLQYLGPSQRPSRFGELDFLANASSAVKGLSVGLRNDGSIVVFARGSPIFIRRGTRWRGMAWTVAKSAISKRFKALGSLLFDAALLLSTTGRGGILGIVEASDGIHDKDNVQMARTHLGTPQHRSTRKHADQHYPEWLIHSLLPTDIATRLRAETIALLASIDGGTIFTPRGRLLTYGAILPSVSKGSEGARSAAARNLSKQGFVIKVSADGPITLFDKDKEIIEL